jgi:NTE family protein
VGTGPSSEFRLAAAAALLAAAAVGGLAGCATLVFNPATNAPLSASTPPNMGAPADFMHENSIVLSLSGGGLRAAAFAHGVLTALESVKTADGDLLNDVALISSVSGSSLTAAHYGLYGREGLARFRNEVLLANFESGMRLALFNPSNLMRMLGGGLNAREHFGDRLDRRVFHGATFADIFGRQGPEIRIQATDLYYRVPFPFVAPLFSILCSDLSRYSVADAVAASMAVPVVFAPVVVRTYPESCQPLPPELASIRARPDASRVLNAIAKAVTAYRDPTHIRFIKLADGGLTDNFAVSTLVISRLAYGTPYAPMTERDAVRIRRLLLIVVDASRGPNGDWTLREAGPSGVDLAFSATVAAVDAAARHAADALGRMIQEWQESVIAFRCGLTPADVVRLGGPAPWNCADVRFSLAYLSVDELESPMRERIEAVPTRLTLEADQVDAAIEGARAGTLALRRLRTYVQERAPSSPWRYSLQGNHGRLEKDAPPLADLKKKE